MKIFNLKVALLLLSLFTTFTVYGYSSNDNLNKIPFLTTVSVVDQTIEEALAEAKITALDAIPDHCGPTSGKLTTFKILRTHKMSENPEFLFDYITIEGEYTCFVSTTP